MTSDPHRCAHCGNGNRPEARVCRHCGRQLMKVCRQCRQDNRDQARFCRFCGAMLNFAAPADAPSTQRVAAPAPPVKASSRAAPQAAMLNGRYTIRRLLAKGGMSAVYAVSDTEQPGTVRAVKEMDLATIDAAEQQDAIAGFRREAAMLRTLSHPNLVKVIDHFTASGKEYLVMEYVQGETLESFLKRRPRTEALALPIAFQLCDVLDYLHSRTPPIIYRDLKPSNAMVEAATGLVKLIDFGIARIYKPGKQKDTKMLGTPGFAPPEQYGEGQTDARSDVFALGVTLHVLLSEYDVEQTPWHYPPISTLNPQVSPVLEQIIVKATAMHVGKRYQSVAEMRSALLACPGNHNGAHHSQQPPVFGQP